jgi:hypothetical protein
MRTRGARKNLGRLSDSLNWNMKIKRFDERESDLTEKYNHDAIGES